MTSLQEILTKSSDCYFNTEVNYVLSNEELEFIKEFYDITLEGAEVTDGIFDILQEIHLKDGGKKAISAPTRGNKYPLPFPMPSLEEIKCYDEAKHNQDKHSAIIMDKLDGCSCGVLYIEGKFSKAYSRGEDGIYGQDITPLFNRLVNRLALPHTIDTPYSQVFVRGELIIPRNEITCVLENMTKETGKVYKSARNVVAGQINSTKHSEAFLRKVNFVAYNIEIYSTQRKIYSALMILQEWGFKTPYYTYNLSTSITDEVLQCVVRNRKSQSTYEIDGLVVALDRADAFTPISETNLNPRYVFKYKVGASQDVVETEVADVQWRISKTGMLKPRIVLKPVSLNSILITYTTGNNAKFIIDNGIGAGAKVTIKRAGDVIPQIVEVTSKVPPQLPEEFEYRDEEKVDIYIVEGQATLKEQKIKQFLFSLCALKVDQAGEASIRKLYESGIEDLFGLLGATEKTLLDLLGVNGVKMQMSLQEKLRSKTTKNQFFAAMGVFGRGVGETILNRFPRAAHYLLSNIDELMTVEGISYITAKKIFEGQKDALELLAKLNCAGYNLVERKEINKVGKYAVVFTGVRDKDLEDKITRAGGKILSSCTNECNLVVAKDPKASSSKLDKARSRGVNIASLEEAREMFKEI